MIDEPNLQVTAQIGREARAAREEIERTYIEPRREELLKTAFDAIESDEGLHPQKALQILSQLCEHNRMLKLFRRQEKAGKKALREINSQMTES